MKLTNRLNLPQPLVDAVKNDSYTSGGADISVTTLLKPPRMVALEKQHKDEIEEDVSTRIWSLMGQVVHGILERASNTGVAERRLSINVEGWSVSGSMDRYIDGLLQDYKVVTAYKFKDGGVPIEYEQQLNVYAEILRQHKHPVNSLQIVGILRDWSKLEARRDANYPQTQVIVREVQIWPDYKARAFIKDRVILHKQARITLPECNDEERWARPTKYAAMREGQARAVKLFESESEAAEYVKQGKNLKVEVRPGELVRCENYCSVAPFCSQFKQEVKNEDNGRIEPVSKPAGSLRSTGKAS